MSISDAAKLIERAKAIDAQEEINGWIIDIDHIADPGARPRSNCNAVGVRGPWQYEGDGTELTCRFRMYDDDGELYYEGRSAWEDFDPLDDFGRHQDRLSH